MTERETVCGTALEPETVAASYEYQGKIYYFCTAGCKTDFEKDLEKYLREAGGRGNPRAHR